MLTKCDDAKESELKSALQSAFDFLMQPKEHIVSNIPYVHVISTVTGEGVDDLKLCIAEVVNHRWAKQTTDLPPVDFSSPEFQKAMKNSPRPGDFNSHRTE